MAVRLGKFIGDGPGIWLRMQAAHDAAKASLKLADEIKRIPTVKARAA